MGGLLCEWINIIWKSENIGYGPLVQCVLQQIISFPKGIDESVLYRLFTLSFPAYSSEGQRVDRHWSLLISHDSVLSTQSECTVCVCAVSYTHLTLPTSSYV